MDYTLQVNVSLPDDSNQTYLRYDDRDEFAKDIGYAVMAAISNPEEGFLSVKLKFIKEFKRMKECDLFTAKRLADHIFGINGC